ncbi:hypothetical protein FKM82_026444 [Ascaphus truei]
MDTVLSATRMTFARIPVYQRRKSLTFRHTPGALFYRRSQADSCELQAQIYLI